MFANSSVIVCPLLLMLQSPNAVMQLRDHTHLCAGHSTNNTTAKRRIRRSRLAYFQLTVYCSCTICKIPKSNASYLFSSCTVICTERCDTIKRKTSPTDTKAPRRLFSSTEPRAVGIPRERDEVDNEVWEFKTKRLAAQAMAELASPLRTCVPARV